MFHIFAVTGMSLVSQMKTQSEKTSTDRIREIFNRIYSQNRYMIRTESPYHEDLICEKSIGTAEKLIYLSNYAYNYSIIRDFHLRISTKYSDKDILAAAEKYKDQETKQRLLNIYKAILSLRIDMRFVNTKAFLSTLHLESHYDTIKEHIHHINKDCLYKFTKQQAWDNTFIRRLAIMYVITSYYKMAPEGWRDGPSPFTAIPGRAIRPAFVRWPP